VAPARHQIILAPEVRELLAPEDVDMLVRTAATGYRCPMCDEHDELGAGPVSVVVHLSPAPGADPGTAQVAHVRLAHSRCSPSQIIHDPQPAQVPDETQMTASAAILPHRSGYRALLITEPSYQVATITDAGERLDPVIAGLLAQGLHLLAGVGERPAPAPAWSARLPTAETAEVLDARGELFYVGELAQPREWRALVAQAGAVELITGVIGLSGALNVAEGTQVLAEAARRGRLIGATICVH
jgi:hypothetical protein